MSAGRFPAALARAADVALASNEWADALHEGVRVVVVPDTLVLEFAANGADLPAGVPCFGRADGRKCYLFRHPDEVAAR